MKTIESKTIKFRLVKEGAVESIFSLGLVTQYNSFVSKADLNLES